jgi:hypothetical protein
VYSKSTEGCGVLTAYKASVDNQNVISSNKTLIGALETTKCDNPLTNYLTSSVLQNWLNSKGLNNTELYLANCGGIKVTKVTSAGLEPTTLTPNQARAKVQDKNFDSNFAIYGCIDTNGKWDIIHNFKPNALKIPVGYLGSTAEVEAKSNAVANLVINNNGIKGENYDDELYYENLDIIKALVVVKDATMSLCNEAKVPEKFWNPADTKFIASPFHGPTLSGVGDGATSELKDIPELVGFGLELATDPNKAKATWNGIKSLTPTKVKKMLLGAASDKLAKYTGGGNIMKHEVGKDGVQMAMFVFGGVAKIKDGAELIDDLGSEVVEKLDDVTDEAISTLSSSVDDVVGKNIDQALKNTNVDGIPVDAATIEKSVSDIADAVIQKGRKPTWTELKALWKRGNDFNTKARQSLWYQFNEVWLEHPIKIYPIGHKNAGKPMRFRLDSYDNGKIVSRKATTLSEIQQGTFENYLRELVDKYPVGSKIANPNIGVTLNGNYFLEIPDINLNFPKLADYKNIASNFTHNGKTYNIQIILKPE